MRGAAHQHVSEREVALQLLRRGRDERGADSDSAADAGSGSDCLQCATLLEHASSTARAFHVHVLPRTLPALRAGLATRSSRFTSRLRAALRPWLVAPLVVTAAILLALWPSPPPDEPTFHTKGASTDAPQVLLRRHGAISVLDDRAVLHPGDALAFSIPPGRARYALVVSIDGEQRINVYSPFEGEASAPIPLSVAPVSLEPAIILDDALGPERIWLLLSDEPLPVARLRPALERLAAAGPDAVSAATGLRLLDDVEVKEATWLFIKQRDAR